MDADLDLLLIAVYVTADDLLPEKPGNAKRSVTDAEVITLCVAQAIMGIPSDRRVPGGRFRAAGSSVSAPASPAGLLQAPPQAHRHAGVADGGLRQPEPRLL